MNKAVFILISLIIFIVPANAQQTIKAGDVLTVSCAEEPKLGGDYNVNSNGLILMQFVGAIAVGGLTTNEAGERISKTLTTQQILKTATITVTLKQKEPETVSFTGAVSLPGSMEFRAGLTVADVIKFAQPTESANTRAIRITRKSGEQFTIDAATSEGSGFQLMVGDALFFPVKPTGGDITVLGAVAKPGMIHLTDGMKLSEAITAVGGVRSDADRHKVELKSGSNSSMYDLDNNPNDPVLKPGDSIVVSVRPITEKVYVTGAVERPGLVPVEPGLTVMKAVDDARPLEKARIDKIRINRKEIDKKPVSITVNLKKIRAGTSPDVALMNGDTIEVPYPAQSRGSDDKLKILGAAVLLFFIFRT